jgi:predicted MPP superfamily phosphohydrolase
VLTPPYISYLVHQHKLEPIYQEAVPARSNGLYSFKMRSWWTRLWVVVCVVALGVALDAFFLEPYRIEVTHHEIQGDVGTPPLKIAHLSDLHTHGIGRRERQLVATLEAEKPDVIFITGDSLAGYGGTYEDCVKLYKQLHAPLGVWFVRGNWENDHPLRRERAFYENAGVHLLLNTNAMIRPGVWVIGLDDPTSGVARSEAALTGVPPIAYKIALFHSPAFFDRIAGKVNLVLAGHTHGGQIRIPLVHPFWLPKGSGRFLEGWYAEAGAQMYVSRGLGTSTIPARFLCRPEIAFITIHS